MIPVQPNIKLRYLVKKLKPKSKLYAEIISDSFPPAVHAKNSFLELIKDEIYIYSTKNIDYLLLVGPVQPPLNNISSGSDHYEFSESISESLPALICTPPEFTNSGNITSNKR